MSQAARVGDPTSHGGQVSTSGNHIVLIEGLPAATLGDVHSCPLPITDQHLSTGHFISGSATVLINGKPALRVGDQASCGAVIIQGANSVLIG